MKHIRIYESFLNEDSLPIDMYSGYPGDGDTEVVTFETESENFFPTRENEEGDYILKFENAEGEEVTVVIGHAIDPEYMGSKMISSMNMVPDSSSDGREYSFVGYYNEIPGSAGAYELNKVLIEG